MYNKQSNNCTYNTSSKMYPTEIFYDKHTSFPQSAPIQKIASGELLPCRSINAKLRITSPINQTENLNNQHIVNHQSLHIQTVSIIKQLMAKRRTSLPIIKQLIIKQNLTHY